MSNLPRVFLFSLKNRNNFFDSFISSRNAFVLGIIVGLFSNLIIKKNIWFDIYTKMKFVLHECKYCSNKKIYNIFKAYFK